MKLQSKIYQGLKVFPKGVAAVLLTAALAGCVADDSLCPEDQPGFNEADVVWLSLDIRNQSSMERKSNSTRSNEDKIHPDEAATAAENFIDFTDLELILMDAGRHAVKRLTNTDFYLTTIDKEDNSQYTIKTKINRAYFNLIGAGNDMWILATANSQGTGEGQQIGTDVWMKTATQISDELKTFTFSPTDVWEPNGSDKRIPMAGLVKTKAPTEEQLEKAVNMADAFNLAGENDQFPLEMQRSMVKIRVIDQTPFQVNLEYPTRIKSVSLCNGNSKGAIMPSISQLLAWGGGTCVVEYSTKPSPDQSWFDSKLEIKATKLENKITLEGDDNEYDQFVCYAAEQHTSGALKPYLHIVTEEKTGDTTFAERSYNVYLTDILSGTLKDMVRNHVYEFQVKVSEKSNIEVSYTICPWVSMSTDIEFN